MDLRAVIRAINVAEPKGPLEGSGLGAWWFGFRFQLGYIRIRLKPFEASRRQLIGGWISLYCVIISALLFSYFGLHNFMVSGLSQFTLWWFLGYAVLVLVLTLWMTEFWRRYVFWKPPPREPPWQIVLSTLLSWLALTGFFIIIGGVLIHADAFGPSEAIEKESRPLYLWDDLSWQLLDSVPGLKVPDTIEWDQPSPELDETRTGWFFVLFKILVILPVLSVVAQLTQRPKEDLEPAAGEGPTGEEGS